MLASLIIIILSVILMICLIIFLPKVKIGRFSFQTFYWPPLIGAILILSLRLIDINVLWSELTASSSMNPLKILTLFISMSALSIVLDEVGLFKYLANLALKKASKSQLSVFIILYLVTSILTIFTSNDVIILTFTPFIIFFCKNASINPIPFLVEEFIAANTFSMFLLIGNPTNIYLASSDNINFFYYIEKMALPTILSSLTSFLILYLLFRKELKKPIQPKVEDVKIINKPIMIVGVVILVTCTILLSISSYIHIEMYLICLISASLLLLFSFIYSLCASISKKKQFSVFFNSIKRLTYSLIPFVLSMFTLVLCLKEYQITDKIASLLSYTEPIFTYGLSSLLTCNLINNIPMSVLFFEVIKSSSSLIQEKALFATIIGSNIGAYITPIGALAGIMWMSILKRYDVKFSFVSFMKYGLIVGIPTILMALLGLYIIYI